MTDRILVAKRARVLLVEDEPMISELATDALEEQGFAITAVSNANDALRRLMAGAPIDLLFTDINLCDGMDGTTLARRVRELRPDLPVIYTSGQSTIDQSNTVEGAMFVSKPYDLLDVGRLIEHLMIAKRTRVFA